MSDSTVVHCAFDKMVELDQLIPNPKNPNTHNGKQIEMLAKIIKYQGWRAPITVSNRSGFITKGHGRLMAAQFNHESVVPVDYQDYDSEADEWADMIADNRIAELAEIDQITLNELMINLDDLDFDLELTGYDDFEIDGFDEDNDRFDEKPEVEFTEVLGEEHNYIVLYFDNAVDWLQAQTLFDVKQVQSLSTRTDGEIKIPKIGIGRVLNGADALERLRNEYQH